MASSLSRPIEIGHRLQARKLMHAAAQSLFAAGPVWIAKAVLLETGWVLRSLYGFEKSAVRDAFTRLLGHKNVHTEDEPAIAAALALVVHGMELADAMRLSSRPPAETSAVGQASRPDVSGMPAKE